MKKLWLKFWNGLRIWGFKRWGGIDWTIEGMTKNGLKSSFLRWTAIDDLEWTSDRLVCTVWVGNDRYEIEQSDVEEETWEDLQLLYEEPR